MSEHDGTASLEGCERGPSGPARSAESGNGVRPDLTTTYLGLELRSPIVASASPLTGDADGASRMEDAGAGAIVLPSLFEEEVLHEELELDPRPGGRFGALRRGTRLLPGDTGVRGPGVALRRVPRVDQAPRRACR